MCEKYNIQEFVEEAAGWWGTVDCLELSRSVGLHFVLVQYDYDIRIYIPYVPKQ